MLDYVDEEVASYILKYQFIIADLSNLLPAWALFLTNSILKDSIHQTIACKFKSISKTNNTIRNSATEPA